MLYTILAVLLALWIIGLIAGQTFGGLIHLLLLCAAIVVVVRLVQGRQVA